MQWLGKPPNFVAAYCVNLQKYKPGGQIRTVKLGIKELLNKEKIGFKELFTDNQLFYTINLLLNKELLPI